MARVLVSADPRIAVPPDIAFTCDYAVVGGVATALFDARVQDGATRVLGHPTSVPLPFLPDGVHDVDLPAIRTPQQHADLWRQRAHWDSRYGIDGREPLTEPLPGFREWAAGLDDRPTVVLGDGEGRHAGAVTGPVTNIELSPVGAATCARRHPHVDVVVGDHYRWLRPAPVHLVATYLPQPLPGELDVLGTQIEASLGAGCAVFIEMARFALPAPVQDRLAALLGPALDVSRDGVERLRFCVA